MTSITVPGIGSGLEVNSIVEQLIEAERAPKGTRIDLKEARLQAQLSGYGSLKSALSQFRDVTSRLSSPTTFKAQSVSVSNPELFEASASSIATPGDYSVEVTQLAQSHSLATQAFENLSDVVGNGTLTLQFGTTDYDPGTDFATGDDSYNGFTLNADKEALTLTLDSTNNTLEGVRDAVNNANAGINASIVNDGSGYRLVLNSEESGADNSLQITVADEDDSGDGQGNVDNNGLSRLAFNADATHLEQIQAGQDAQINVNGLTITRPSNSVTGVIPGVTLDLLKAEPDKPAQLSVSPDTASARTAIDDFVASYNELRETLSSLTRLNVETGEKGALLGDAAVRNVSSRIRREMNEAIASLGADFKTLADIGITTQDTGALAIDEETLQAALDDNPEAIALLFAGEAATEDESADDSLTTSGIADRLDALLTGMLEDDGLLEAKTEGIQSSIDSVTAERARLETRLTDMEDRLRSQFTSLDVLLGQLRNTSDFLTSQLDTLPTIGQSN